MDHEHSNPRDNISKLESSKAAITRKTSDRWPSWFATVRVKRPNDSVFIWVEECSMRLEGGLLFFRRLFLSESWSLRDGVFGISRTHSQDEEVVGSKRIKRGL